MMKKNSNSIMEYALAFLFVLPYAETGPIIEFCHFTTSNTYWRAILTIELVILVVLMPIGILRLRTKDKKLHSIKSCIMPFIAILFFCLIFSFLINGIALNSTTKFLMILVPLMNAYLVQKLIVYKGYDIYSIIRKSVFFFALFVVFSIIFNIVNYGFTINFSDETKRLTASAGGPVILGYTISVVFAFVLSHRECFKRIELLFVFSILLLGIFLTQDRGALLILGICGIYLLKKFSIKEKALILFFVILSIPFIINEIRDSVFFERLTESKISNDARVISLLAALSIYFEDFWYIFLGHGLEGFFPYQHWLLNTSPGDVFTDTYYNIVQYGDKYVLVQPHNTFIYFLMEIGFVGVYFFCRMLYKIYKNSGENKSSLMLVLISIICMSMLESALILEPGIACTLWLMLFYSFMYKPINRHR